MQSILIVSFVALVALRTAAAAAVPDHPFSKYLPPGNWRSWYDYGNGAFGDWGPHILDTAHRFLKLGLPERITAVHREGVRDLILPMASTIRFGFPSLGARRGQQARQRRQSHLRRGPDLQGPPPTAAR